MSSQQQEMQLEEGEIGDNYLPELRLPGDQYRKLIPGDIAPLTDSMLKFASPDWDAFESLELSDPKSYGTTKATFISDKVIFTSPPMRIRFGINAEKKDWAPSFQLDFDSSWMEDVNQDPEFMADQQDFFRLMRYADSCLFNALLKSKDRLLNAEDAADPIDFHKSFVGLTDRRMFKKDGKVKYSNPQLAFTAEIRSLLVDGRSFSYPELQSMIKNKTALGVVPWSASRVRSGGWCQVKFKLHRIRINNKYTVCPKLLSCLLIQSPVEPERPEFVAW